MHVAHAWYRVNACGGCSQTQVKREDMDNVMKELGADWDRDELADALEALDPKGSGSVDFSDFVRWWLK